MTLSNEFPFDKEVGVIISEKEVESRMVKSFIIGGPISSIAFLLFTSIHLPCNGDTTSRILLPLNKSNVLYLAKVEPPCFAKVYPWMGKILVSSLSLCLRTLKFEPTLWCCNSTLFNQVILCLFFFFFIGALEGATSKST